MSVETYTQGYEDGANGKAPRMPSSNGLGFLGTVIGLIIPVVNVEICRQYMCDDGPTDQDDKDYMDGHKNGSKSRH